MSYLVLLCFLFQSPSFEEARYSLTKMRNGRETDFEAVEQFASKLLKEYPDSLQTGRIHYEVVHIYAQSGHPDPDRLRYHAGKSLESPINSELRLRVHMYVGDSLSVDPEKKVVERRLEASQSYLTGLKEHLEAHDSHNREAENFLFEIFQKQVVNLYQSPPYATSELKSELESHLGDSKVGHKMLEAVVKFERENPAKVEDDWGVVEPQKKLTRSRSRGRSGFILVASLLLVLLVALVLKGRSYASGPRDSDNR